MKSQNCPIDVQRYGEKEEFQGDQAGQNKGHETSDEAPAPTPGPQGEDVPVKTIPVPPNTPKPQIPPQPPQRPQAPRTTRIQPPSTRRRGPGIFTLLGLYILRTFFFLLTVLTVVTCSLYSLKLTGIYDPCESHFAIIEEKCQTTPHLRGMVFWNKCTRTKSCLLPGFSSYEETESWSLTDGETQNAVNFDN